MRITTNYMLLASVLTAGALASACSEEKFQETPDRDEIYAREFIKEFGTPDPDHDWTMATTAGLRVNAPDPVSLQVYAEIDGKLYIFADIPGYKGENAVPVTIPKGTEELIVVADGTEYRCSPSATLDLTTAQPARGSRATHITFSDHGNVGPSGYNVTIDNSETATISFNPDENLEIVEIIKNPFNSKYIKIITDDGVMSGGPLMPNMSIYHDVAMGDTDGYELYPLFINNTNNTEYPDLELFLCNEYPTQIVPTSSPESKYLFPLASKDFGIFESSNGYEWSRNCMPAYEPYTQIKCSRMRIDFSDCYRLDLSYALKSPEGWSYSYSRFNYPTWKYNFYDAAIKDMNECYCSAILFKEVPIKWYRQENKGKLTESTVNIWGLYKAPSSPAAKRPEKPDVFIMEHHDYGHVQWTLPFYKQKDAQTYKWRLFAEDLGGSHDWDFNDLVIEYSDIITRYIPNVIPDGMKPAEDESYTDGNGNWWGYPKVYSQLFPQFSDPKLNEDMMVRKITVTPLAAGGTLPIYFAFHGKLSGKHPVDPDMLLSDYINNHQSPVYHEGDFVIGCEMHKWLGGSSHHTPLNVGETKTHSGKEVTFYTTADLPNPNDRNHTLNSLNLNNFRVLVDPDNTLGASLGDAIDGNADIKSVDINAWNGGYVVNKPSLTDESKTPQVLIANINSPWTKEGKNFGEAYPYFGNWIRDPNSVPLWTVKRRVEELLVKE